MPKIREYNEEETFKLDESFKETLARVKPHILTITCAESAHLCKAWLNKLHDASSQRRLRNEYLMELYRQLKTGRIGGIFHTLPPNGSLLPLPKSYHMVCISSSVSDLSDYVMKPHRSCMKPTSKYIQHQRSKGLLKHRMMDFANMSQCLHAIDPLPTVRFHEQKLQDQKEYLWNQFTEYPRNDNKSVDYVSASISRLTVDVTALKSKLIEMHKLKNWLEKNYKEAVQEYHHTVVEQFNELKRQLNDVRLRNKALDSNVVVISNKLEEIVNGKGEVAKIMNQQWTDKVRAICERFDSFTKEKNKELQLRQDLLDKRDVELSKKDAERKEETEVLINRIRDLEAKLEIKIKNEDKLQGMVAEQYANMKEEFNRMRIEVDHETQKQNQILMSKVSIMKKTVSKLEKSKEKLECDYEKRLSYIVKNKDMEIKALKLQLHEQKNELCASLSTKKQSEVDNIVSILEKRYRTLLAETEAMSENQTQEYLRKIAVLEEQILNLKKF